MARQMKRIKKNIKIAEEIEETLREPEKPKHKPWETFVLVAVICMTLILLTAGWDILDGVNRGMYGSLLAALLLMYVQRRKELTPVQTLWAGRVTFFFIMVSLALFGYEVYTQHIAG